MTSKSRLIAIATALGIALTTLPAGSQPAAPTKEARDEAKSRFLKGLDLFKEGDYQAALIEFRRANELAPNYNVLYNIGQVYFQLTDYPNALMSLERYLKEGGDQVSAKRREEVQKDIDKLRARIANLDITTNVPEVDIAIDDISQGRTPFQKPLMVGAGRHRITASKEGFRSVTKVIEVAGADSLKIPLELQEQRSNTPPPPATTGTSWATTLRREPGTCAGGRPAAARGDLVEPRAPLPGPARHRAHGPRRGAGVRRRRGARRGRPRTSARPADQRPPARARDGDRAGRRRGDRARPGPAAA